MPVCHIGFLFLSFSVSSFPFLVPSPRPIPSTPFFSFCSLSPSIPPMCPMFAQNNFAIPLFVPIPLQTFGIRN
uniref:Putative secreted peptide n=1 Tax=Anopheles braziliensis TaxID=58242 RepID=A0A2M3ZNV7_9DIPT